MSSIVLIRSIVSQVDNGFKKHGKAVSLVLKMAVPFIPCRVVLNAMRLLFTWIHMIPFQLEKAQIRTRLLLHDALKLIQSPVFFY